MSPLFLSLDWANLDPLPPRMIASTSPSGNAFA
jgi:hypothetical protein